MKSLPDGENQRSKPSKSKKKVSRTPLSLMESSKSPKTSSVVLEGCATMSTQCKECFLYFGDLKSLRKHNKEVHSLTNEIEESEDEIEVEDIENSKKNFIELNIEKSNAKLMLREWSKLAKKSKEKSKEKSKKGNAKVIKKNNEWSTKKSVPEALREHDYCRSVWLQGGHQGWSSMPYPCVTCKFGFMSQDLLQRHNNIMHNVHYIPNR